MNKIKDFDNKKNHIPVMLDEVINYLEPKNGETILDGTFGAGGYTKKILDSCICNVIGIDRDENIKCFVEDIKNKYGKRFEFFNIKFSEIKEVVKKNSLDGLVLDLGVSSMQLDNYERGFSFNKEAPLKMTMGKNEIDAYKVVNKFKEKDLADIIYKYGEESKSKIIAKKIIDYRKHNSIETTTQLAEIVRSCFATRGNIDNATKTFQAIRIYVNSELDELKSILEDSIELLKSGGRLVVVSFHSLEDRIIKEFFKKYGDLRTEKINKYKENENNDKKHSVFKILTKKPVLVSKIEAKNNKRARSAKLRGGIKCWELILKIV